ncbi:ROK family protein [Glaciimonas soli]|uniref:ROK family protein n=1 Tax=Glaciimonas soli TaxID=2590999 RepID=A0A843YY71_9BURK|nr:ROK family protein [Glaciimonas soli]MQR02132.1 ROK family protein [Glaciimonas soli]
MLIAIDIGGTKIAAAWVENGKVLERRQQPMAPDPIGFMAAIAQLVLGWPAPQQVAVAATGFINDGKVHSVNQNIIAFWDGFPLAERLAERFACPLILMNDGQAAAWGEYQVRQSASENSPDNLLFITLSTGVGGGLVLDRKLRIGPHGLAGHVGHATVSRQPTDGDLGCGCGRHSCLEKIASGTALGRQASAMFGRAMNSAELFELALTDTKAEAIINNAAMAVAEAISNVHMTIDLSEIVIGGSVGLADGMLQRIQLALARAPNLMQVPVSAAILGPDAGLVGIMQWANAKDA